MILDLIFAVGLVGGVFGIGGLAVAMSEDVILLRKVNYILVNILCGLIVSGIILHTISNKSNIINSPLFSLMSSLTSDAPLNFSFADFIFDPFISAFGVVLTGQSYILFVDKMLGFKMKREESKEDEH